VIRKIEGGPVPLETSGRAGPGHIPHSAFIALILQHHAGFVDAYQDDLRTSNQNVFSDSFAGQEPLIAGNGL